MPKPKNFRLDEGLRARFEAFCADRLMNEKKTAEALILHFLETKEATRRQIIGAYNEWRAAGEKGDTTGLKDRNAAKKDPRHGPRK